MQDILLNTDLDLDFANGDFVLDESTEQHQLLLLTSFKGDFKENPDIGVGAAGYLKSEEEDALLQEIKQQFEKDGMTVKQLQYTADAKLNINAYYP